MITDTVVQRLARAAAHGSRQMALVNELLAHGASRNVVAASFSRRGAIITYGKAGLNHSSFVNLRRRLHASGFVVYTPPIQHHPEGPVILTFPEQENA